MKNLTERMPKDLLKWTAAGFALVATATAEYEIARAIGMNEWIAAAVPGALDAYVVRALRTHREVLTSVVAMVGVNAASHLVTAGILPVEWPLITAVSAIAPLVLWRVHALGTPGEARRRLIWGLPWRARPAGHTSTEPEHAASTPEGCVWGHAECDGARACMVYNREHATGTPDLDVPDWVNPPSTPVLDVPESVPVMHVQRVQTDEHTSTPSTLDLDPVLLPYLPSTQPMKARHLEVVKEHAPSTRTADDWNLEHVSTGVLDPEDTEHMERARELFHTIGGVPPFRALKEGTPGMGTPRAKRIRAALKIEAEGTD